MAQVAAGTKSPEVAGKLIASLAPPARPAAPPRITPPNSRPYGYSISEKGNLSLSHRRPDNKKFICMSKDEWAAVIVLAQDGSIAKMLADPNPQMSESYAQRLAAKQAA